MVVDIIRNSAGVVVSRCNSMSVVRQRVGTEIVERVDATGVGGGRGKLHIRFANGDYYETEYLDFGDMLRAVHRWRNLRGAPLYVNGVRLTPPPRDDRPRYSPIYHSDGTVTVWDLGSRRWLHRVTEVSDEVLLTQPGIERSQIKKHLRYGAERRESAARRRQRG